MLCEGVDMKLNWFRDGERFPLTAIGGGQQTAFEERPQEYLDYNLVDYERLEGVDSQGIYVEVESIMSAPALSVTDSCSAAKALSLLEEHDIRHLLVVSEQAQLLGILSDRDLLGYLPEELQQVTSSELMAAPVLAASPDARVHQAARVLWKQKFSCLPVVDGAGRPVGVVTVSDILRFVLERPWLQLYS